MEVSEKLRVGQKFYYPSDNGIALLCQVVQKSRQDILVRIGDRKYFLPRDSVDSHAIVVENTLAKSFVTQRIEDPDNSLVYLRYMWRETLFDRLYNWYCRKKGRINHTIIPAENLSEGRPGNT